jgi:putative membrane protein
MKVMLSLVVLAALTGTATAANTGNPGGMVADTPGLERGQPTSDHANPQDKLFVRQATLGGRAEVDLGKLAQGRADSSPVRDLGAKMAADHGKANDQLARIGRSVNAAVPAGLDPADAAFREELQREKGAAFDQRYLIKQIGDHQRTLNLLQWELSFGQNQALKDYATEMLPTIMEHLRMAQAALAALTGSAPPQ